MKELLDGTVLQNEQGVAKKTGHGWKVKAANGSPFDSKRFGARPGEKTNVVWAPNKREAKKILRDLDASKRANEAR